MRLKERNGDRGWRTSVRETSTTYAHVSVYRTSLTYAKRSFATATGAAIIRVRRPSMRTEVSRIPKPTDMSEHTFRRWRLALGATCTHRQLIYNTYIMYNRHNDNVNVNVNDNHNHN